MTSITQQRSLSVWVISVIALVFGLMTIKEGGSVLFGARGARSAAGNYIPFVVWFNFLAGFAYVVAGVGLWLQQRWATGLAIAIVALTALASAALGFLILAGTAFEQRTVFAMGLRTVVWVVIANIAWRRQGPRVT
jgi:hypothetical protein